jgi:hypothetical protein
MKYDFEKSDWPNEARVPYRLMRWWFLDAAYVCCRGDIHYNNRWHAPPLGSQSEYTWAYSQYQDSYSRPIENLMLEVVVLILYAGRASEQTESTHRQAIADILKKHDLKTMLAELPADERREFVEDMRTLQLEVPADC